MTKRRGNGEGSVYQRESDGRWCASLTFEQDGKQRRKTLYGKTRKEVVSKLQEAQRAIAAGRAPVPDRVTVGQYLQQWLDDVARIRVRPRTYRHYSMVASRHILPAIGQIQLSRLQPDDVQRMLNHCHAGGLAASSVACVRDILRTALGQAVRWDLVQRNVASLVELPRSTTVPRAPITAEDARRFRSAAAGNHFETLYILALSLGLRQSELLGLRWRNIDFDTATLTVTHALQSALGHPTLDEPKSRSSRRTIPLPAALIRRLRAHRARQLAHKLTVGVAWEEHDLVFPNQYGGFVYGSTLRRNFLALRKKAGLPTFRFHDLRHACATFLADQGVPPRTAMEILGHSDIHMTLTVYTRAFDDSKRAALESLDTLLDGEQPDDAPADDAPARDDQTDDTQAKGDETNDDETDGLRQAG